MGSGNRRGHRRRHHRRRGLGGGGTLPVLPIRLRLSDLSGLLSIPLRRSVSLLASAARGPLRLLRPPVVPPGGLRGWRAILGLVTGEPFRKAAARDAGRLIHLLPTSASARSPRIVCRRR